MPAEKLLPNHPDAMEKIIPIQPLKAVGYKCAHNWGMFYCLQDIHDFSSTCKILRERQSFLSNISCLYG